MVIGGGWIGEEVDAVWHVQSRLSTDIINIVTLKFSTVKCNTKCVACVIVSVVAKWPYL